MVVLNSAVPVATLAAGVTFRVPGDDARVFVRAEPGADAGFAAPADKALAVALNTGAVVGLDPTFGVIPQPFAAVPA